MRPAASFVTERVLAGPAPQPFQAGPLAGSVIGLLVVQRPTFGFIEFAVGADSARPARNSATAAFSASDSAEPCMAIFPLTSALTIASGESCRSTSGVGALTVLPGAWHVAQERSKTAWPFAAAGAGGRRCWRLRCLGRAGDRSDGYQQSRDGWSSGRASILLRES